MCVLRCFVIKVTVIDETWNCGIVCFPHIYDLSKWTLLLLHVYRILINTYGFIIRISIVGQLSPWKEGLFSPDRRVCMLCRSSTSK